MVKVTHTRASDPLGEILLGPALSKVAKTAYLMDDMWDGNPKG